MVDYAAVLRKTISSLPRNTPEIRERIYAKARQTVLQKLDMIQPPPSDALRQKQVDALEGAIAELEAEFAPPAEVAFEDDIAASLDATDFSEPVAPVEERPQAPEPPEFQAEPVTSPEVQETSFEQEPFPSDVSAGNPAPADFPDFEASRPANLPDLSQEPALPRLRSEPDAAPLPTYPDDPAVDSGRDRFDDEDDDPLVAAVPEQVKDAAQSLDEAVVPPAAVRKSGSGRGLILGLVGLVLVGGAGYLVYQERDTIFGGGDMTVAEDTTPTGPETGDETPGGTETPPPAAGSEKFTQRLQEDGTEIDAGPAGASGVQSVAQLEPGSQTPAVAPTPVQPSGPTTPATEQPAPLPVGEQAIFYEERTTAEQGTAKSGAVVWSLVQESPGNDLPPEAAIRGEVTIAENGVTVRMTLRRNADETLPASHILEMVIETPEDFAGGSIEEVQRVNFKPNEAAAGRPLIAVPVRIADGFFLVALDSAEEAETANLALLNQMDWIDIPVVYRSGRRALFTMEKGVTGTRVFDEALAAWGQADAG